ncbi:hypothetical protein [Mammaliicoccus sp. R-M63]|uniref:hypothetical protein n=1 Tax=Mammaliicoccus sp. R-M63 TaxID=2898722 RepID=UPI001EFA5774|nr:hypothetical protein [Mammaliicoccus sp. R-M63]
MKKLLFLLFASLLVLGACGSGESNSNKDSQLSAEDQEDIYKKESKKLGKAISVVEDKEDIDEQMMKDLNKAVERYENKTKDLDSVDTEIGDYASRVANITLALGNRYIELEDFKKDNADKKDSYDLALVDLSINMAQTLETINMDYEDFDAEYKNEYLGKEGNESVANILTEVPSNEIQDVIDGYGAMIIEYDEELNEEQKEILSNTDYRKVMNKAMITEEPDVSKNEYNESVEKFNSLSPDFLHYDKVDKMISATENIAMTELRNGVVGANTDYGDEDYDTEEEEEAAQDEINDLESDDISEKDNSSEGPRSLREIKEDTGKGASDFTQAEIDEANAYAREH